MLNTAKKRRAATPQVGPVQLVQPEPGIPLVKAVRAQLAGVWQWFSGVWGTINNDKVYGRIEHRSLKSMNDRRELKSIKEFNYLKSLRGN